MAQEPSGKEQTREAERQRVLADLALLDSAPEAEFDALTTLAKRLFGTKIALFSLPDRSRLWFKARCGIEASETARDTAFCRYVIEEEAVLLVPDARLDPRFEANPLVRGAPHIRFYAGVPVCARLDEASIAIGSLCVIDDRPREAGGIDPGSLKELASLAEALVEARAIARRAVALAEARRETVECLERERRRFSQAERMAHIGSWRLTLGSDRMEWSDGVFAVHELPVGGLQPLDAALDYYPPAERARIEALVQETVATGQPFDFQADLVTARGNPRRVRSLGEVELSQGRPVALVGVFQDITERHTMEQALRHHARTDELTGLPNRADFNRVLDERLIQAQSREEDVPVLLLDLDGFKGVNDRFGHAAGDEVLRRVGERLRAPWLVRAFAARLGGDEFAIIAPACDSRDDFRAMIDRLLAELRISLEVGGEEARVSATCGIAWSEGGTVNRKEILRRADAALYSAKRTRKGTAQVYDRMPALSLAAG